MKILVTGGGGFLGVRLVKRLVSKGHDVTVFSRHDSSGAVKAGAKQIIGNVSDYDALSRALEEVDVVYHLAANLDESDHSMERENRESTENVIRCSLERKVKRVIFTSSIGVLGNTDEPATEGIEYNPTTRYEKSKMECEKLIAGSGIDYAIARITIIYGPNRFWGQIFKAAKKGYPVIGSGRNFWHLVYVDDAADALCLMLADGAKNQIYHIADDDPHTYLETYKVICDVLHLPEPKKHVPEFVVKAVALVHETKCRIIGKRPNVTKMRSSIDRLIRNRIVSIEKAKKELGYRPKFDLRAGMGKTAEGLKE